jgi:hypothetical protein
MNDKTGKDASCSRDAFNRRDTNNGGNTKKRGGVNNSRILSKAGNANNSMNAKYSQPQQGDKQLHGLQGLQNIGKGMIDSSSRYSRNNIIDSNSSYLQQQTCQQLVVFFYKPNFNNCFFVTAYLNKQQ